MIESSAVRSALIFAMFLSSGAGITAAVEPFSVHVVDSENGWPVPLVQMTTTSHVVFVSDNAGNIAIDSPELMNRDIWLTIQGHGYRVDPDYFGETGVLLKPMPGGSATVEVQRMLPAKRLGRLTGAGIFSDTQKLGEQEDWAESGVMGCDTVQVATYRDELFWTWGDTSIASHPLGLFGMTGATTILTPIATYEPPLALAFNYFRDSNNAIRNITDIEGVGPTWLSAMVVLSDSIGTEHLVATYAKIEPPLEEYELGLCEWSDDRKLFLRKQVLWTKASGKAKPTVPRGHAQLWQKSDGDRLLLFADPFPFLSCEAKYESWMDAANWKEIQTPKLIKSIDQDDINPHRGSICYNEFRKKWIAVFCEIFGSSPLGEIWYVESESPLGPWSQAVKIVTHDNYSFYNPRIDVELTEPNASFIVFEGSYTRAFADNPPPTARYEYNQIMYRLDFDEDWLNALGTNYTTLSDE